MARLIWRISIGRQSNRCCLASRASAIVDGLARIRGGADRFACEPNRGAEERPDAFPVCARGHNLGAGRASSASLEVEMVEGGPPAKKAPHRFRIVLLQVGRLCGSVATMILGAVALGCAIAGVTTIVVTAVAPRDSPVRAFASVVKTGVSPLAGGPIESRSAWVDQRKKDHVLSFAPTKEGRRRP